MRHRSRSIGATREAGRGLTSSRDRSRPLRVPCSEASARRCAMADQLVPLTVSTPPEAEPLLHYDADIDGDDRAWMPINDIASSRPLLIDVAAGTWFEAFRTNGPGLVNRHFLSDPRRRLRAPRDLELSRARLEGGTRLLHLRAARVVALVRGRARRRSPRPVPHVGGTRRGLRDSHRPLGTSRRTGDVPAPRPATSVNASRPSRPRSPSTKPA